MGFVQAKAEVLSSRLPSSLGSQEISVNSQKGLAQTLKAIQTPDTNQAEVPSNSSMANPLNVLEVFENSQMALPKIPNEAQTKGFYQMEIMVPSNPSMANPLNVLDVFENGQKGLA